MGGERRRSPGSNRVGRVAKAVGAMAIQAAESQRCSFCGKLREEVKEIFSKDDGAICIDCLKIYEETLSDYAQTGRENPPACWSRSGAKSKQGQTFNFQPQSKDDYL